MENYKAVFSTTVLCTDSATGVFCRKIVVKLSSETGCKACCLLSSRSEEVVVHCRFVHPDDRAAPPYRYGMLDVHVSSYPVGPINVPERATPGDAQTSSDMIGDGLVTYGCGYSVQA